MKNLKKKIENFEKEKITNLNKIKGGSTSPYTIRFVDGGYPLLSIDTSSDDNSNN